MGQPIKWLAAIFPSFATVCFFRAIQALYMGLLLQKEI